MDVNSIRKRLNQLQTTNNGLNLWKPQRRKQIINYYFTNIIRTIV